MAAWDSRKQIFGPGFRWITPLLWVCFPQGFPHGQLLRYSGMPTLFNTAGLTPEKPLWPPACFAIGGTVGGLLIGVLLDRFGFAVIAVALFVCAALAIAAIGASGVSYDRAGAGDHRRLLCPGADWGDRRCRGPVAVSNANSAQGGWVGRSPSVASASSGDSAARGQLIKMNLPMRQPFLPLPPRPWWKAAVATGAYWCGCRGSVWHRAALERMCRRNAKNASWRLMRRSAFAARPQLDLKAIVVDRVVALFGDLVRPSAGFPDVLPTEWRQLPRPAWRRRLRSLGAPHCRHRPSNRAPP